MTSRRSIWRAAGITWCRSRHDIVGGEEHNEHFNEAAPLTPISRARGGRVHGQFVVNLELRLHQLTRFIQAQSVLASGAFPTR